MANSTNRKNKQPAAAAVVDVSTVKNVRKRRKSEDQRMRISGAAAPLQRNKQFLVDSDLYNKFKAGDMSALSSAIPPFSAPIDRHELRRMMNWEANSIAAAAALQKDPYYRFARLVSQQSHIALDQLWITPQTQALPLGPGSAVWKVGRITTILNTVYSDSLMAIC